MWRDAPKPGLIYLDIEMPGMDGQAVLKAIKADPDLRDIPVVMMTGVSDESQMQHGRRSGSEQLHHKTGQGGSVFEDGGHQHELLADDSPISGPSYSGWRLPEISGMSWIHDVQLIHPADKPADKNAGVEPSNDIERLRLLIVEDDADQRQLIGETLEEHFGAQHGSVRGQRRGGAEAGPGRHSI